MKSMQVVVHTTGGDVRSAVESVTERLYEDSKTALVMAAKGEHLEFNTENGWVVIPHSQILYVEIELF